MTEPLLVASSPVLRVEGETVGRLARDLTRLEVAETVDGLRSLEMILLAIGPSQGGRIRQEDILYLDGTLLDFGTSVEVTLGPYGQAETVFRGFVSAVEMEVVEGAEPVVTIRAEDRLMDFRTTRRQRSWEEVTDGDIAREIAAEHGLGADVSSTLDGGGTAPTWDVVHQWNQSDLAFLRQRARRIGYEIWLDDDTLHFHPRSVRAGQEIELVRGNHLISVRVAADLAHQRTEVRVSGYDARSRESVEARAGDEVVLAEVAEGVTGPATLARAFGDRVSYRVRDVPLTETDADAVARAELLGRARSFVTVEGVTRGTPELDVGSRVSLSRVGTPFDGDGYRVTAVRQSWDLGEGHRTAFSAERPFLREGAR